MRTLTLAILLLTSFHSSAQEILVHKKPDPSVPAFGTQLKKSTVYIEEKCSAGENLIATAKATGFLVAYIDSRLTDGSFFAYLVTNRHVSECWKEPGHQPMPVLSQFIRANAKDGTYKDFPIDPKGWRYSDDESVDLAVTPVIMPSGLDVTYISAADFATKDFLHNNQIAEGSPIVLAGYFYQFPGDRRFESIVRQGIISMIPEEPLVTTTGKPGTLYLCDAHIFGGNSGSPVMVTADSLHIEGFHLLGIISGFYHEDEDLNLQIATTAIIKGTGIANSGVATVVPVDFLKDILEDSALKTLREQGVIQFRLTHATPKTATP